MLGANAILDGYYREAVSSFASSMERFYEFAIRVLFEKSSGASKELFENSWRKVSSRSEQQLGAFIFLWTYCLGETPKLLSDTKVKFKTEDEYGEVKNNDITKFRNNVIHNGIIPTREEALKYGNAVIEVVRQLEEQLVERFSNEVSKVTSYYLDLRISQAKVCKDKIVVAMVTQTPISFKRAEDSDQKTLEKYLEYFDGRGRLSDGHCQFIP
jgi:hypothetical protein